MPANEQNRIASGNINRLQTYMIYSLTLDTGSIQKMMIFNILCLWG